MTMLPQVAADDYTVTITKVQLTNWCHHLDKNDGDEEWAWNVIVDGKSMCVTGNSDNSMPWEQALQWEADFTTQSSQLTIKIDAWEKDADGAICTWAHGDDPSQRVQDEFTFSAMTTGQTQTWSRTMTFQNRDDMPWDGYCSTTIEGRVTKIASSTVSEGAPRIMGTQITLVNNVPKLRITGRDLHPDPQELPVVQITGGGGGDGGSTACIANSIQASAVEITCNLVKPESAMVSSLDLQVQVETRFGLSRTAPTSFAKCGQECLHGGACWWSKDISNVECVCPELAYGEWCENEYGDEEPILRSTAPLGGDHTRETETVIALVGLVIPRANLSMMAKCVISHATTV
ncbi:uncharacterized protein ACA1_318650, partial [Acanthamoeba castellanii str. Neff]